MVPASQGDAVLIGQRDHVVRVHVAEDEADQSAPVHAGTKKPDAAQFAQARVGVGREGLIVLEDVLAADGVQIIHRRVHTDRPGDVRRARLEAVRSGLEPAFLPIDAGDHLAAALVGRHLGETLLASVEHAETGRPEDFVGAEHEEIAADGLHVHRAMPGGLRGIDRVQTPSARARAQSSAAGLIVPIVLEMWTKEKIFTSGVSNSSSFERSSTPLSPRTGM